MVSGVLARAGVAAALALSLVTSVSAAAPTPPAAPDPDACRMAPEDAAWLAGALQAWELTRFKTLRLDPPAEPPTLVLFDQACVWRGKLGKAALAAGQHDGTIALPGGDVVPAAVLAFAAPDEKDHASYVAMALPSVWKAAGVTSPLGVETLMIAAFVHETAHTRQFDAFVPRMARIARRWNLPREFADDAVQARFGQDGYYVRAYRPEVELLYRAAAEPDAGQARVLARQALDLATRRRAHFFTGVDRPYLEVEDSFLTLEGIGNFAAYRWLTDPQGAGKNPAEDLADLRRGGARWSQDEGLAIYLVVDRFVPDWRARAFAKKAPATALQLLALAVE